MGVFRFEGVTLVEAPTDAVPACPKCEKDLNKLWVKAKGTGLIQQQQIILCPHCKTFLGFGTFSL